MHTSFCSNRLIHSSLIAGQKGKQFLSSIINFSISMWPHHTMALQIIIIPCTNTGIKIVKDNKLLSKGMKVSSWLKESSLSSSQQTAIVVHNSITPGVAQHDHEIPEILIYTDTLNSMPATTSPGSQSRNQ